MLVGVIMAITDVKSRVTKLDAQLAGYIPLRDTWNPVDEAMFKPADLYDVPLDEAQQMQLKAIKYAFAHHYNNNKFYHKYCQEENVRPDDVRTVDDFDRIPLLFDKTFKQYPSGKDFARWLATVFTGDLPQIAIRGANPTFDDVINAFNAAGLVITYSSGTSGLVSVIPRDMKTFKTARYGWAKSAISMVDFFVDHALMCFPKPAQTNLFMALASNIIAELAKNDHYALDIDISAELSQKAMSKDTKPKGAAVSASESDLQLRIVAQIIQWLEYCDKTKETFSLAGPPFLLLHIINTLRKEGKSFDFGERGSIASGGGWKTYEDARIPLANFRKQVNDVLGIPETRCTDGYGMCESNATMFACPEGHYLHTPYTFFKPFVVDDAATPVGYGKWGRFAFLDAIAQSYPGFVVSGDRVRLLECCPICDRPGPVLEPEIKRAKGAEVRGCAEQLRRIIVDTLTGDGKDPRS
jgi:long-chain-fatty-acid---luciferin-component ligase